MDDSEIISLVNIILSAVLTIITIAILYRQQKIMEKQGEIELGRYKREYLEVNPCIEIIEKKYIGNSIQIDLRNSGSGLADEISILASVTIFKPGNFSESNNGFFVKTGQTDSNKQNNLLFSDNSKEIRLRLGESVNLLSETDDTYSELKQGESGIFTAPIKFSLYMKNDSNFGRFEITFNELVELCMKNKVDTFDVELNLIYKNTLGDLVEYIPIDEFCVIVKHVKNSDISQLKERYSRVKSMKEIKWLNPYKSNQFSGPKSLSIYRGSSRFNNQFVRHIGKP